MSCCFFVGKNGVATDANFEFVAYGGQCSDVGKCWLNTWELCNLASISFGKGSCGDKISVESSTKPAGCYAHTSSSDPVFNMLTTDYGTVISGNPGYGYFCSECVRNFHENLFYFLHLKSSSQTTIENSFV